MATFSSFKFKLALLTFSKNINNFIKYLVIFTLENTMDLNEK